MSLKEGNNIRRENSRRFKRTQARSGDLWEEEKAGRKEKAGSHRERTGPPAPEGVRGRGTHQHLVPVQEAVEIQNPHEAGQPAGEPLSPRAITEVWACAAAEGWAAVHIQLHLVWMEPKEQHWIHELPGRAFLDRSQRQCPSRLRLHLEWTASGTQEPAGGPWTWAVAKCGRSCHRRSVFTGFVWKLSVGLGSSWEILSNCVPWGWREAKYNSLSQRPKWGQAGSQVRPPEAQGQRSASVP